MLTLPDAILPVLHPFAMLFRNPTWLKAQILLVGTILTPGQRTVAAALRVMGRSDHLDYARYHEVLNRAVWSPRQAARILLMLLLQHLDQGDGPLVFGIDETLERCRGPKIKSLGIYRDAVRSSRSHLVKVSGLRWVSLMWLGHVPWAGRYWALPFLTVRRPRNATTGSADAALYAPAPPRQTGQNGRPPLKGRRRPALKALLDLPTVSWTEVPAAWYDGTTRTVELTSQTAVWYRSGKPPVPLRWVLVRDPQGEFTPQALLCTDPSADPAQILEWFVLRRQLEVTPYQVRGRLFQEVRAHLGVETQRQWSDRAIARTTPILMGLFSWTTLAAHLLRQQRPSAHRTAAWYAKPSPTFVDAIALCAATCGWRPRVFHCPPPTLIYGKPRPLCTTGLSIPLLTPLELRKVQTGPLLGHTGLAETIPQQPGVPPVITRMLVY